jgi:agmatine/peptidylarginine deiminase
LVFLLGSALGCGGDDGSGVFGTQLPPSNFEGIAPLYPSAQEQNPAAKADALAINASHPEIYGFTQPPPAGSRLVPEWAPGSSVLVAWHEDFDEYHQALIAALASFGPTWVITPDLSQSEALAGRLAALGVDMVQVGFLEYQHEAFWTRDYGPWSVVDRDGTVHFVDPSYYPTRFRDDALPTLLAAYFDTEVYRPDLDAEGGNIMFNGGGLCVATYRLPYNNPPQFSFDIADWAQEWLGCQRTVFLESLDEERTGHVDLFAKFLAPDLVVVSEYDATIDPANAWITNQAAETLAGLTLADGRSIQVARVPAPPVVDGVFRTYTNALQTDRALFVPIFDGHEDTNEQALAIYRALLPAKVEVVPINASAVIKYGGAVHCTTMQMHQGAVLGPPDPVDEPQLWSPPAGALGEVVKAHIEGGTSMSRNLEGPLTVPEKLGKIAVHLDLEGRTPNQIIISLSNGGITQVLHDGRGVSVLDPMPADFVVDAFDGLEDTGTWTLTLEVEPNQSTVGLHRWYIRPKI